VPLGHGREAVVGRRDADWAHGNSAIADILLLSAVWVVGVVFANCNAPALGKILHQQGVGNLTFSESFFLIASSSVVIVQTKSMRDAKSTGIVPMHEWTMPQKYWGMFPS
jgi:hypothetical protein